MWEQITSNSVKSLVLVVFFVAFVDLPRLDLRGDHRVGALRHHPRRRRRRRRCVRQLLQQRQDRPRHQQGTSSHRWSEYPHLHNSVEGLAIAAGLPKPALYVIEDSAPNAFATGRNPEHAAIAVTTGLLDKLNRAELEGVIGHEMSHIADYDTLLMTHHGRARGNGRARQRLDAAELPVGRPPARQERGRRAGGDDTDAGGSGCSPSSPPSSPSSSASRYRGSREFLADANAARLTRFPEGLANALEKIAGDKEPLEVANKATAHLYIENPLKEHRGGMNALFSTHPPVEQRITALRSM